MSREICSCQQKGSSLREQPFFLPPHPYTTIGMASMPMVVLPEPATPLSRNKGASFISTYCCCSGRRFSISSLIFPSILYAQPARTATSNISIQRGKRRSAIAEKNYSRFHTSILFILMIAKPRFPKRRMWRLVAAPCRSRTATGVRTDRIAGCYGRLSFALIRV